MPNFRKVTAKEMEQTTYGPTGERARIREEYEGYIKSLRGDQGGELKLADDEKKVTIKNRLQRAANDLGVTLNFKRSPKDVVLFTIERS
ncbi:MAG: hypothetical protein KDD73_01380 [Anaerolineales bacterium]|nr:hypothetical protein [Anaerolineales bacterium]